MRISYDQQIERMRTLSPERGYVFHGFCGDWLGSKTKCILECADHGKWDSTDINHFLTGRGCPRCARVNLEKLIHPTRDQVERKVQSACDAEGIKFSRWLDDTRKSSSRIALICETHGEYVKNIDKFLNSKERCQACVRNGFNRTIDGFLYLLESECGWFYKIGITNHPKQRFSQLRRATPFKFNVEKLLPMHGSKAHEIEIDAHKRFESANMEGFDGCTEWIMKNISVSDYIEERAN
jgi:hypothetical protein